MKTLPETEPIRPEAATLPGGRTPSAWRRVLQSREAAATISPTIFAAVFVGYAIWLGSSFADFNTRVLDLHQNTPVLFAALGLCLCLVVGQFDLTVGSMATLTCFLSIGLASHQGLPMSLSIVVCLAVGVVSGLVNSVLVLRLKVNAFIATLATGGILGGISHVYSKGVSIAPGAKGDKPIPGWFTGSGSLGSFQSQVPGLLVALLIMVLAVSLALTAKEQFLVERTVRAQRISTAIVLLLGVAVAAAFLSVNSLHVPWTVFLLLSVTVVLWVTMRYTEFGRRSYAVGGNPTAARLAGVPVERQTTIAFVLSGTLAAAAGVILAANQGSASPDIGVPYLLPAFAAVFLSTVLFSSGRFHVWGTVLGGFVLVTVGQGLIVGGLEFTWTDVVNGVVLAAAVAFSTVLRRAT